MNLPINRRRFQTAVAAGAAALAFPAARAAGGMALFDAHVHYSHDAWSWCRRSRRCRSCARRACAACSCRRPNDEGTQKLVAEAPDLIVPELRPYRTRAESAAGCATTTSALPRATAGEVPLCRHRRVPPVRRRCRPAGAAAHGGAGARARPAAARAQRCRCGRAPVPPWPQARILWAHSGFDRPDAVRAMLRKHKQLWCDLAYRTDQASATRSMRRGARRSPSSPIVSWSAPTPSRPSAGTTSAARRVLARLARRPAGAAGRRTSAGATPRACCADEAEGGLTRRRSLRHRLVGAAVARDRGACRGGRLRRRPAGRLAGRGSSRAASRIAFVPRPAPLPVGRTSTVDFVVCAPSGAAVTPRRARRCRHAGAPPRHELPPDGRALGGALRGRRPDVPHARALAFDLRSAARRPTLRMTHEIDVE